LPSNPPKLELISDFLQFLQAIIFSTNSKIYFFDISFYVVAILKSMNYPTASYGASTAYDLCQNHAASCGEFDPAFD